MLSSVQKKHFVVLAKERNTVFYAQETLCCLGKRNTVSYAQEALCCLGKRKKYCFLCTRHTLLSRKKKETLFSVHKKHFVVLTKERNTVSYAQETLCCLDKRKKYCFLCTRNTLLSWQKKEKLFPMHKKHSFERERERTSTILPIFRKYCACFTINNSPSQIPVMFPVYILIRITRAL